MIKMKKGLGRAVYFDEEMKEEVLLVENKHKDNQESVIIPKSEIGENKVLDILVGKLVDYVDVEGRPGIASMKKAMPMKREALLKKFERGEVLKGRITDIKRWGAYLTIDGVSCLIRNTDFASDYSRISDVYKVGDTIDGLVFRKVSERDRIALKKLVKYESPNPIDLSKLKKDSIILGTVRNVKTFGCFVAVAKSNIDALCPVPENLDVELEEGMTVKCKLNTVELDTDERKIRGKILAVINEIEEE